VREKLCATALSEFYGSPRLLSRENWRDIIKKVISKKVKVIGLTGPIGAGKDEVARTLKRRGAYIINADSLAHKLYSSQTPLWHELVKTFGSKILMRGGKINRKKLGEIVFSDRRKLDQLNRLVHPRLKEAITEEIKNCDRLTVINAAVLKEIGLLDLVDQVWLVTAPKELRLKRLINNGLAEKEAKNRIKAQASAREYSKIADVVINNAGTLKQLSGKIQASLQF
jgi:dephospho-CoA kinase